MLAFIECIEHFLADVDSKKRRHRDIHMPCKDQFTKVAQEQCAKQGCDVQTIGIRIRKNTNLVITKIADVGIRRVDAQGDADVVHFL